MDGLELIQAKTIKQSTCWDLLVMLISINKGLVYQLKVGDTREIECDF